MNSQFIRDESINYLMELRIPLYKYLKRAFQFAGGLSGPKLMTNEYTD